MKFSNWSLVEPQEVDEVIQLPTDADLVRCGIESTYMIRALGLQFSPAVLPQLLKSRKWLSRSSGRSTPIALVQRLHPTGNDEGSFRFTERVSTEDPFSCSWWGLVIADHQVHQCVSLFSIQPVALFLTGDGDLGHILRELNSWLTIYFHQFVHTTQCWLLVARYQLRADSISIYFMPLFVQSIESVFVDVIAGGDDHVSKALCSELFLYSPEEFPRLHREVRQVSGVQTDAHGFESQLVEGESNCTEVGNSTLQNIVSVDQCLKGSGKCQSVGCESCQLAVVRFSEPVLQ
ncbi:hypothetical protein Mapa_002938 [Marchantia paleacea]|nr:hypothetical protein Mapa_002938 [Marchantia paleacea]